MDDNNRATASKTLVNFNGRTMSPRANVNTTYSNARNNIMGGGGKSSDSFLQTYVLNRINLNVLIVALAMGIFVYVRRFDQYKSFARGNLRVAIIVSIFVFVMGMYPILLLPFILWVHNQTFQHRDGFITHSQYQYDDSRPLPWAHSQRPPQNENEKDKELPIKFW